VNDPPSISKLASIIELLKSLRATSDTMSATYIKFQNVQLAPGMDPVDFLNQLMDLLTRSRPTMSHADKEFLVRQKFLSSLPESISNLLRVIECKSLHQLASKASISLSGHLPQPTKTCAVTNPECRETEKSTYDPAYSIAATKSSSDIHQTLESILERLGRLEIRKSSEKPTSCDKCGSRGHPSLECLGKIKCFRCGLIGHTKWKCPSNNKNYINNHTRNYSNKFYVGLISSHQQNIQPVKLLNTNTEYQSLIDTGAAISLISYDLVKNLNIDREKI
ncbi:hypothetical protein HZS_2320, partial [Henneguya salminicola]